MTLAVRARKSDVSGYLLRKQKNGVRSEYANLIREEFQQEPIDLFGLLFMTEMSGFLNEN